jgi:hypothetical protein
MILNYYYYKFTKAIPKDICEKIINLGKQKTLEEAKIDNQKKAAPKTKRDSKIIWLNDQWIYELIQPWLNAANKEAKWNFNIDWNYKDNYKNVYHYDMSEDVVKIAGVEFYSLTGHFPKKNDNFRRTNTFKYDGFTKQYKYILGGWLGVWWE